MIDAIWNVVKFVLMGLGFGALIALALLFTLYWLENRE
jgi:hypothetical protein